MGNTQLRWWGGSSASPGARPAGGRLEKVVQPGAGCGSWVIEYSVQCVHTLLQSAKGRACKLTCICWVLSHPDPVPHERRREMGECGLREGPWL